MYDLDVRPRAEEDLSELVSKSDRERVIKKLEEVEQRLEIGLEPETAVEKRLSKGWSPILQQRAGNYRLWFVKGSDTEKGDSKTVYCIRILPKEDQQKLMGVNINPDTYL